MDAADRELPARDRVEYVLHDDLPKLPHPLRVKIDALRKETEALERHDVVHSYSPAFLPVMADLVTPTLVTINSYLPVCPKSDLRYHGKRKCSGPGPAKCVGCVATTSLTRRQGVENELRAAYSSLGKYNYVRTCLERSDEVTAYHALSPHIREDYDALGFPADRITVIPHFYDEQFHERAGEPGEFKERPSGAALSLLYVGALQDIKGVDVLLRALPDLAERGLDVDLRVAGTGPYEANLRRLADRLNVADSVTWLGYVDHDDLPMVYDDADVFVYPGRIDEPFGRVMLEALASGTPVVASDVGSTDYIVGNAGVRFPSENPAGLADACERLVADYETYRGAVPAQLDQFAPERVVSEFRSLYERVASAPDHPPTV